MDNNLDLFNTVIPELPSDTKENINRTEVQEVAFPKENSGEFSFVAGKFALAFCVMILCALFICSVLYFIKKKGKTANLEEFYSQNAGNIKIKKNKKKSNLNTPSTIKQCIHLFLDITKKN